MLIILKTIIYFYLNIGLLFHIIIYKIPELQQQAQNQALKIHIQSSNQMSTQSPKQVDQLFKDPTNTFKVQNPQVLPPLTNASKTILKNLLHSTTMNGFKINSEDWINHLNEQRRVKQMIIRIKQINTKQDKNIPKYSIQFHPIYQKFSISHFISRNAFQVSSIIHNFSSDSLKQFGVHGNWNYVKKQFSLSGQLNFYGPIQLKLEQKWSKPLDKRWVADCRLFTLNYLLKNDSKRTGRFKLNQFCHSSIYWQMKGYQTRLRKGIPEQPGFYLNQQSLKKVDLIQTGYQYTSSINEGQLKYGYRIGIGTDYYNTWYGKLKTFISKYNQINTNINLLSYGQFGIIDGKNIIPHQMFSRNQTKWMGERSKVYIYSRFDILARNIKFLQSLNLIPSNYLSIWVSRSYDNKIKAQAELGVSISVPHTMFRIDFNLLRLAGIKGQPRFGLKYQF